MFTLRFIKKDGGYKAYSIVSYEVTCMAEGISEVEMSRKLNGQDSFTEYVGDGEVYAVCYITNTDGKTIDSIKQVSVAPIQAGGST